MASLLPILLPVFALIGIGFVARRAGLLGDRAGDGLADYVFTLAVPFLLFRTLARVEIPAAPPWGYWSAYFAGAALSWVLAMLAARRLFGREGVVVTVCGLAAAQSNTVLVGIPLILTVYGEAGSVPLAMLIGVHLPITMTVATLLAEGREASPLTVLKRILTHPIIVGILLGSAARPFVDLAPGGFWQVVDLVAGTAAPCALVTLGIALARYRLSGGVGLPVVLSALKLGLHPLIVFVLARHVFAMPPAWSGVAVLFAACPCGINAYLFAERYKQGMAETSSAMMISTGAAAVTMLGWLALLGVGG